MTIDIQKAIPHIWDLIHADEADLRLIAASVADNDEAKDKVLSALERLTEHVRRVR